MSHRMLIATEAALAAGLILAVSGCGGGGTSAPAEAGTATTTATTQSAPETTSPAQTATTPQEPAPAAGVLVDRGALRDCLAAAGLAPEDTGLFVIGSAGTDVEALGVRTDRAGRVLLFVFDGDATSWTDYVAESVAAGAAEVSPIANVVVAYEAAPSDGERSLIEACLAAEPGASPQASVETAAPEGQTITTSVGSLVVDEVELGDTWPPGCDEGDVACNAAAEGYQVLTVWLARADGGDAAEIGGDLFDAAKGAYVTVADGSKTKVFAGGMLESRLVVAFTPPVDAHGFTLFWPDNPGVELPE